MIMEKNQNFFIPMNFMHFSRCSFNLNVCCLKRSSTLNCLSQSKQLISLSLCLYSFSDETGRSIKSPPPHLRRSVWPEIFKNEKHVSEKFQLDASNENRVLAFR
jgi:hypothetical protein